MPAMYTGKETVAGKTVVVTGANDGIGKETVRELAMRGGRIIMACRNTEKGEQARNEIVEETKNEQVVVRELDLSSLESVQNFADNFNKTESRLDILINNAGVMVMSKELTKDGLESHFGVNHIGHFLLTNLLLDKLKACSPSRIINVSSVAQFHSGPMKLDDLNSEKSFSGLNRYSQSKLANVLHVMELTKRLQGTGVTATAVHPGFVRTKLVRQTGLNCCLRVINNYIFLPFSITPVQGAQTSLKVALDKTLETVSGKYFADCKEKPPSIHAQKEDDAKRLWELSEEIVEQKLGALEKSNE